MTGVTRIELPQFSIVDYKLVSRNVVFSTGELVALGFWLSSIQLSTELDYLAMLRTLKMFLNCIQNVESSSRLVSLTDLSLSG